MKRGADDLSSSTSSLSNSSDSYKRPRTTHVNTTPSKVIHIRNVPLETTEGELYTLCAPFGKVETAVIMKGKGQALVQMQEQAGATALVDFYTTNPAMLRTNMIHLQYSTREEITNKPAINIPGNSGGSVFGHGPAQGQNQSHGYGHGHGHGHGHGYGHGHGHGSPVPPPPASSHSYSQPPPPGVNEPSQGGDCRVLLVNVANVQYPVTIDLLYSVFCKYGTVTKIVTFSKSGFQAFVQFSTPEAAELAKNGLDGQNIYVGCCSLRINFSTIKDLDIKYNNEKSRDFTNPYLPRSGGQSGSSEPPAAIPYYPPPAHTPYPDYGGYSQPHHAAYPPQSQSGMSIASAKAAMGVPAPGTSPVVIVSGLNEEQVTPDSIFTLFGVYGDVLKVKILFTKKDTALVQLATPQQADTVIANLNGATMYGKPIRINYSKHATIMIPSNHPNEENVQFTKEYVGSPLHRFRNPNMVIKHICPPSSTLHVSSIPPAVAENELRDLFSQQGQVVNVKFFMSEKRMALVQMENIPDATTALIALHNYKFPDTNVPIRVSFAKSTIYT
eukprot:Phypoly_transcript_02726.p1 GENE.Phypoly_transcript_02726~~Phypoly_transcript_02726.p1  ORF type:complete len:556 (+),score=101.07 Phypoly_transcript_02726:920-2587(+)